MIPPLSVLSQNLVDLVPAAITDFEVSNFNQFQTAVILEPLVGFRRNLAYVQLDFFPFRKFIFLDSAKKLSCFLGPYLHNMTITYHPSSSIDHMIICANWKERT